MTRHRSATPGFHRAWIGDEVDRLIAWMQVKFADATLQEGAGEAAMVIRVLQRERDRLAHEAKRQSLRRRREND
jgi:hypothetical protein